ncbi:hypothetical protein [Chryseobacterium daecheongense]|uniref:Uncharacterized protein n=1 Tax=Chryseobacterium daecheongense TaxID=192389 RepID=A0A3N0W4Y3_9FLAO|nr:hypothetical protein [Chryseobacterium daecheongense]ROH99830.1 hypothetical protein EGI05_02780 [Chryseobacterium daecheongense]TDX95240.1 hypothetical protein BCF50_1017 [Chryseobacterium daecheongense]
MIPIKIFKFESNLEFVSNHLNNLKINHIADYEKKLLLADENEKDKIINILNKLNLDESDVELEDDVFQEYDEWNNNMYNPGYYTGGKSPSFDNAKSNYLAYGFVALVSSLAGMAEYINSKNFSKTGFWILFFILLLINLSLFYQYFKHKRNSN